MAEVTEHVLGTGHRARHEGVVVDVGGHEAVEAQRKITTTQLKVA